MKKGIKTKTRRKRRGREVERDEKEEEEKEGGEQEEEEKEEKEEEEEEEEGGGGMASYIGSLFPTPRESRCGMLFKVVFTENLVVLVPPEPLLLVHQSYPSSLPIPPHYRDCSLLITS